MGTHMVLDISITHPCGDGNQPWVRMTAADAWHASKHHRLRDHLEHTEDQFSQGSPDGLVFVPAVFETYGTPTKETLKLIHSHCNLHSHLHLHDAADCCAARHYWVRQASNALQCANARQLHDLTAAPTCKLCFNLPGLKLPLYGKVDFDHRNVQREGENLPLQQREGEVQEDDENDSGAEKSGLSSADDVTNISDSDSESESESESERVSSLEGGGGRWEYTETEEGGAAENEDEESGEWEYYVFLIGGDCGVQQRAL
jgi:hypothetical protein